MDVRAHFSRFSSFVLLSASLALAACGGGGGGGSTGPIPAPGGAGNPTPLPTSTPVGATPTPLPTATPHATPTPVSTATPSPTPVPAGNYEAPAPQSFMRSSYGRIGDVQILDRFFNGAGEIAQEAPNEDAVWGAFNPSAWTGANPNMVVSLYVTPELDANRLSGHDLNWFQTNHPDWILYGCDSSGNPTHELAYMPGLAFPDVPLDFHNSAVVDYMVRSVFGPYMIAHGYNALAADNVNFGNVMVAGNPNFGESTLPNSYACGIWQGNTFVRRYSGIGDTAYGTDLLNWMAMAKQFFKTDATLAPHNFHLVVNHPIDETSFSDSRFQNLLSSIDGIVDEHGFSNYNAYFDAGFAKGVTTGFINRVSFVENVQRRGVDVWETNYFCDEPGMRFPHCASSITTPQLGYSMATYLISNLGNARLYANTVGDSYSYHPEYQTNTGPPCGEYTGGFPVYSRKFLNVLAVVNIDNASHTFALPPNHQYTDVQGRQVTNPLQLQAHDGWILQTSNGCN